MKVTVKIPDTLFEQLTASATLKGQTIEEFIVEAIRAKLTDDSSKTGWQAAFGAADPQEVAEGQRIIDEEFSRIDLEEW